MCVLLSSSEVTNRPPAAIQVFAFIFWIRDSKMDEAQGHSLSFGGLIASSPDRFLVCSPLFFTMRYVNPCHLHVPRTGLTLSASSLTCRHLIMTFHPSVAPSSTRRVDNSNTRLAVQMERDPGKKIPSFSFKSYLSYRWLLPSTKGIKYPLFSVIVETTHVLVNRLTLKIQRWQ